MKTKPFFLSIVFIFLCIQTVFPSPKNNYSFPVGASLLNITVEKGSVIFIEIDGKGWYANRYSRDKISILLRIIDDNKTIFKIRADKTGEAYVFFSLVGEDKYLHMKIAEKENNRSEAVSKKAESRELNKSEKNNGEVSIESTINLKKQNIESEESILEKETHTIVNEKKQGLRKSSTKNEEKKSKNPVEPGKINEDKIQKNVTNKSVQQPEKPVESFLKAKENKKKTEEKQNIKNEIQKSSRYETAKKKKEPEIYYIDSKSNKKVVIPVKDESKDYYDGVSNLKSKNYENAVKSFNSYLDKCEKCSYREDAIYNIARAYQGAGSINKALQYYSKIAAQGMGKYYISSLNWLAEYYVHEKKLKKAMEFYQKIFKINSDPSIKKKIADIAFSIGDISNSLKGYKYCIEHNIVDDKILYRLASIYDRPGIYHDIEKAYKMYRRIIDDYPDSKYFDISKRRVSFFEKNFINFK